MKYDLAIVNNTGSRYVVLGTIKKDIYNLEEGEEKYVKLSYSALELIKKGLADNKVVTLRKDLSAQEALPDDVTISDEKISDLELLKLTAIEKIHKKLEYLSVKISNFEVLRFTLINNELISKGYVITNDNREEQYIKIIETDDEKLIDKLEKYLIILDKINDLQTFSEMVSDYIDQINDAKTEKDIQSKLDEFYSKIDLSNK